MRPAAEIHVIISGDLCLSLFGKGSVSLLGATKATFTVHVSCNIDFMLGIINEFFYQGWPFYALFVAKLVYF
jgi:hypothetical protein